MIALTQLPPTPSTSVYPTSIPLPFSGWGLTPQRLAEFGHALVPTGITLGCLLVGWLVLGAYLSRRKPLAFWYGYGFWFLRFRMRRTWSKLALNADLNAAERPNTGVLGSLVVKGRPLVPAVPLLTKIRPRPYGASAVVLLHPGQ